MPNLQIVENVDNEAKPTDAENPNPLDRSREIARDESTNAPSKRWSSRVLHRIGTATEQPRTGLIAAGALVTWIAVGFVTGFPRSWESVLVVVSSSVTVVMVFVLQHTQARQQAVTQRKLDELLHAQPTADDRLIALEDASDDELAAITDTSHANRERALKTDTTPTK
jgi:low affinity Fe/Cu permease